MRNLTSAIFKPPFKDCNGEDVRVGSFVIQDGQPRKVRDYNPYSARYQDEFSRTWYAVGSSKLKLADDILSDDYKRRYEEQCSRRWQTVDSKNWKAIRFIYASYLDEAGTRVYRVIPVKSRSGTFSPSLVNGVLDSIPRRGTFIIAKGFHAVRLDKLQQPCYDVYLDSNRYIKNQLISSGHQLSDPEIVETPGDLTFVETAPSEYQVVKPDGTRTCVITNNRWPGHILCTFFDRLKSVSSQQSSPRRVRRF